MANRGNPKVAALMARFGKASVFFDELRIRRKFRVVGHFKCPSSKLCGFGLADVLLGPGKVVMDAQEAEKKKSQAKDGQVSANDLSESRL